MYGFLVLCVILSCPEIFQIMTFRRYMAFIPKILLLAAVAVGLAASCGGDDDDGEASGGGTNVPDDKTAVHEYVYLDISDGTLWATTNIGAARPEGKGSYSAWAETAQKGQYSWDTYSYCAGSDKTLTKYCAKPDYGNEGYTDKETLEELQPADDAATAAWGSEWRTPSLSQWETLVSECDWKWDSEKGVPGFRVSSRQHPEKSIFLPAAGRRTFSSLDEDKENGYYWSRTLDAETPTSAYALCYFSYMSSHVCLPFMRFLGYSVRPVRNAGVK